jgi:uncharacterized protein YabN with tetrapyrrole methylase and pyrophosphatase domain
MVKSEKPCLLKVVEEQEITAKKFGFYWERIEQLIEQIQSECVEVEKAWETNDRSHLAEEVGDLMQASVSLAIFCGLDPHETLRKSIEKFQKRYDKVVRLAARDGLDNLHDQSTEILMDYWNRAKQLPIE